MTAKLTTINSAKHFLTVLIYGVRWPSIASSPRSKPLSLLASMPAGNVAGLIDLEGEPAEAFGGGEDGAGGEVGSGSERVARLSDGVAGAVALPWGCRARVAAGNVVLAHWKVGVYLVALPCLALS